MPDPVVGLVGRTCAAHPLDGALEQRLVRGPLRDDRYPSSVADDPMPKRQVEQERAAEPEVEVRGLDQRSARGSIIGQQIEILGQSDHGVTVRPEPALIS